MPITWTTEQVLALAPDPASMKAGKDLAGQRKKWADLGRDERAAWGECQGSGSKPYQTQIDLSEPAFSCSCPSRKFPCKHGLGLFLMLVQQPAAFAGGPPPAWVADWLAAREKKAEDKARKTEQKQQTEADPEQARKLDHQQARRAAERQAKVDAGLNDLDRWLGDLARRGLAAARGEPYSFWEGPAARLVDAQAPGLARQVRELAGVCTTGDGWQDRLLERLGRLHLLIEGYRRIDALPPETRADIRSLVGWTQGQEELLASEGVRDRWVVLGQKVEEEDRLRTQRRWLWGEATGRAALVLHFAHAPQPLDTGLVSGMVLDAELVFFRGRIRCAPWSRRASRHPSRCATFPASQRRPRRWASMRRRWPGTPGSSDSRSRSERGHGSPRWALAGPRRDRDRLSLACPDDRGWVLMALGGGRPIGLFGEWNGEVLVPSAPGPRGGSSP
jgi:hypothetical protein